MHALLELHVIRAGFIKTAVPELWFRAGFWYARDVNLHRLVLRQPNPPQEASSSKRRLPNQALR